MAFRFPFGTVTTTHFSDVVKRDLEVLTDLARRLASRSIASRPSSNSLATLPTALWLTISRT